MDNIFTGQSPRIIGATVYALNRTHGLAPAREAGKAEKVVEVIDDYSGVIKTDAGNVYANGDFGIFAFAECGTPENLHDFGSGPWFQPATCAKCGAEYRPIL